MTANDSCSAVISLFDLAESRKWSLIELRNRLQGVGLCVSMPTLYSWRYGKRNPSAKKIVLIHSAIETLSTSTVENPRKFIRVRVTSSQIEMVKQNSNLAGISVAGIQASLINPFKIFLFADQPDFWFPLADSVIWLSHIRKFAPHSEIIFQGLFQLLKASPDTWLECFVDVERLEIKVG